MPFLVPVKQQYSFVGKYVQAEKQTLAQRAFSWCRSWQFARVALHLPNQELSDNSTCQM
jgi:hypothetical protein